MAYAIILYIVGIFMMESQDISELEKFGHASQEEYVYTTSDGEEREDVSLISIKGIGKVLTYPDVYFAPIVLIVAAGVLAKIMFDTEDLKYVVFANWVIGLFLLYLTSKQNIISTVLYWCGIILASFATNADKRTQSRE